MPYSNPTSPLPSPEKDSQPSVNALQANDEYNTESFVGPSSATGPMPGIPRRSSSNHSSAANTPRRGLSPAVSRQTSASRQFPASRALDGLPRRLSVGQEVVGFPGLPRGIAQMDSFGSLGLSLHPTPTNAQATQRGTKDSISSTSTVDSSLPPTPCDEERELPLSSEDSKDASNTIPFPAFEPPPKSIPHQLPRLSSPSRPTFGGMRRSSSSSHGHHRAAAGTGSLQIDFTTSASTSNLPAQGSYPTSSALRPTSSMIRKKSGEVVKPSLKSRSMSTPDLTRQQQASEPSSPESDSNRGFPDERSKSVRFADAEEAEGKALESVVLFLREQKVTAVGRAADPERAGHMTETETENDTDASDFVQFRTKRNAAARAADEERLILEGGSRVPRVRVDFSPDVRGSLAGEHIVLERVELVSGSGPLCLKGTAIARNIAFHKWVAVRFTLDHWQTVSEVSATHVCHIPSSTTGDEGWDRFSFSVKLEDFKRKLDERQLVICLRYSVEGREWWDSNDGINYNFTFKKAAPRRQARSSTPASLAGGYMQLDSASTPTLPGLRQGRGPSTAEQISRAFGSKDVSKTAAPRDWIFPKYAAQIEDGPSRSASPALSPPPLVYKAPGPPDPHTHLSLSRYCAPSPRQSPSQVQQTTILHQQHTATSRFAVAVEAVAASNAQNMDVVGDALAKPLPQLPEGHDRRSSWNGQSEDWDSFTQVMQGLEPQTPRLSTDGEITPVAVGSRSPAISGESEDSSPEIRPLKLKRSNADLRSLMTNDEGLITPPPSNMSSPPSPGLVQLPDITTSPSPSAEPSTGESSPINTVSSDTTPDLESLDINIDPEERGRTVTPNSYKMLSNSYQEFLDKFCFFQSPRMTPNDESIYSRPSYIPTSGRDSPNGFPFDVNNSSNWPRGDTPTPTRQYDSSHDAFGSGASRSNAAKMPKGINPNTTPKASPPSIPSPLKQGCVPKEAESEPWRSSPSLAAAN